MGARLLFVLCFATFLPLKALHHDDKMKPFYVLPHSGQSVNRFQLTKKISITGKWKKEVPNALAYQSDTFKFITGSFLIIPISSEAI